MGSPLIIVVLSLLAICITLYYQAWARRRRIGFKRTQRAQDFKELQEIIRKKDEKKAQQQPPA